MDPERPPQKPTSAWKRALSFAATPTAIGLLGWVIYRHGGVEVVTHVIESASTTWPLLLLPYLVGVSVTILAYRTCLPGRGRDVPLPVLVLIERSGSALNSMLPLGDSSGNLIKVALLRHWYSSEQIVAAGAWGALATGLCNCLAGAGPLVAYALGYLDGPVALIVAAAGMVASIPAFTLVSMLRTGLSTRAAKLLTLLPARFVTQRRAPILAWASRLDRHLAAAVGERRADFRRLVCLRVLWHCARITEIWTAVELIGAPGGIVTALLFHATNRSVTQIFAFIPGRLGILELVTAGVFGAVGLGPTTGVEIALMLRFAYFLNLALSTIALTNAQAVARRYPARLPEELRGLDLASENVHP
jgi:hypothetical protein